MSKHDQIEEERNKNSESKKTGKKGTIFSVCLHHERIFCKTPLLECFHSNHFFTLPLSLLFMPSFSLSSCFSCLSLSLAVYFFYFYFATYFFVGLKPFFYWILGVFLVSSKCIKKQKQHRKNNKKKERRKTRKQGEKLFGVVHPDI